MISDEKNDIDNINLTNVFEGYLKVPEKVLSITNSSDKGSYFDFPVESEHCYVEIWIDEVVYGAERIEIFVRPAKEEEIEVYSPPAKPEKASFMDRVRRSLS